MPEYFKNLHFVRPEWLLLLLLLPIGIWWFWRKRQQLTLRLTGISNLPAENSFRTILAKWLPALRVRVTSSDGVIRYATRKIVTQDNCPECPEIDAKFSNGKNEVHMFSPDLTVAPNPATDDFGVKFELQESDDAELALYNQQGQVIAVLYKGKLERGRHQLRFKKAGILAGSYVLRLRTEQSVIARKFVIFE